MPDRIDSAGVVVCDFAHEIEYGREGSLIAAVMQGLNFSQDWQDRRVYHSKRRQVEIGLGWDWPRLTLSCYESDHMTLSIGLIFMNLYFRVRPFWKLTSSDEWELAYGFYTSNESLVLECGRGSKTKKFFYWPWTLNFHRHWEQRVSGYLNPQNKYWIEVQRGMRFNELATKYNAPYTYHLKNGTVQNVEAEFHVERMEWRRRIWPWLPLFNLVRDSISVTFSSEVGERSGSWKGGCTGCSYEMLRDETPLMTLRRMERERKFN